MRNASNLRNRLLTLLLQTYIRSKFWFSVIPGNAAEKLVSMYYQELTLKEKIWPEYTRSQNRNMQLVFLSLWIHQPYLEESHKTVLESMLLEVGLR